MRISKLQVRVILLGLTFICWCNFNIIAQINDVKFDRLTIEDGLSQNTIVSISQDAKGFIWVGTQDGLNKFDGYNFEIFANEPKNPNTLIHSCISSVNHYDDSKFVIGTVGGLDIFDIEHESFTHLNTENGDSTKLSTKGINCTLTDVNGALWVGTVEGLKKIDPKSGAISNYTHQSNNPNSISDNAVTVIFKASNGNLWVGTENGLNKFSSQNNTFTQYYSENTATSISNNEITAVYEDDQRRLWIGTPDGLNLYQPESDNFIVYKADNIENSISDNRITTMFQDSKSNFWVGTKNGLNKLLEVNNVITFQHYVSKESDPNSLSGNWISAIFEDRTHVLWVGTYFGGLNKHDLQEAKFNILRHKENDPQSLSSNIVRAIVKDHDGNVWVGTNPGLNKIDRKTGRIRRFFHDPQNINGLSDNVIRSLCVDRDGLIWIGTGNGGLNRYDPATGLFKHFKGDEDDPYSFRGVDVRVIYEGSNGDMWIGSNGQGLFRFERKTGRFINYRPDKNIENTIGSLYVYYAIQEDNSGNLWIGTWEGLDMLDLNTGRWRHYAHSSTDSTSLSDNYIKSILIDHEDNIWASTAGRGLNKLIDREKGYFEHYTMKDGLANNFTYGVLQDSDNNLWISTNKGMSRFNPVTKQFKNYDRHDGLQGNEFNSGAFYESPDGEMFFGGINGLSYFWPTEIKDNMELPKVGITNIQLFNKPVSLRNSSSGLYLEKHIAYSDSIILAYNQNFLSFEFAALHFSKPVKNQYAYQLEGVDKEWIYTKSDKRFANYTSLSPGEYTFKVKASNHDGIWQEIPTQLSLIITPPIWQTWWFLTLCGVWGGGLILGIHRYRVYAINKQKNKLELLVQERTAEIDRKSRLLIEKNSKIVEANKELQSKQDEIQQQNREILLQNDEILSQNDEILAQNEELDLQRREIENSYTNMRIISSIGNEVASMLDFEKIILKISEHVNNLMDASEFGIGIYDDEQQTIQFALYIYEGERLKGFTVPVNSERFTSWSVKNKKAIWIGDVHKEYSEYLKSMDEISGGVLKSLICIPLIVEKRVMGVLSVQSHKENAYSQYQFDILNALATYIAVGLDNSKAYNLLESKVKERTRDLNNAYKELVITNKNFDEFAYRSAHDLRGPLARILGLCHLGQLEVTDKEGLRFLSYLQKVAFEMDHMLGRLLRTHQNKKTPVTKSRIDIRKTIDNILQSISKTETLDNIKLEFDINPAVQLESDLVLFKILLENVILNAIHFQDLDQDDKRIKIKVDFEGEPQKIIILVMDNGIGIPKEQEEKIFDMFSVCSEASKGSGLGLYEAKLIAGRLGGEIYVCHSEEGDGFTTIKIVLNQ